MANVSPMDGGDAVHIYLTTESIERASTLLLATLGSGHELITTHELNLLPIWSTAQSGERVLDPVKTFELLLALLTLSKNTILGLRAAHADPPVDLGSGPGWDSLVAGTATMIRELILPALLAYVDQDPTE